MKYCCYLHFIVLSTLLNNAIRAQVPVSEEPRHKVVLLNKYVRLLDVHIPPHDTTLYHRHSTPSAVVFISRTITGSQLMGGEPIVGQAVPGNTFFAGYGDKPITHRVWNQDTSVFHVMDIELLSPGDSPSCAPVIDPFLTVSWEQKMIRMYSIHLEGKNSSHIKAGTCPHLLISISGSVHVVSGNAEKHLQPGDFIWYPAGNSFQITSENKLPSNCAMLELK